MGGGKGDFFTKEGKDNFPSLTFLAARLVYYINLNCMYNIRKSVLNPFECNCLFYSGCTLPNGAKNYCELCMLNLKHDPADNERVFSVRELIKKIIEMVNDIKQTNVNIDNSDYTFVTFNRLEQYSFWNSIFSKECLFIKPDTFY